MRRPSDNLRILAAAMVEKANSGHPGGAMGGAEFIHLLYSEFLRFDPSDPHWRCRDRFFLDPGHMSPMLYAQLALIGKYSQEELKNFRQWGSVTPGHPEVDVTRGVENSSGPLGQGHVFAVGAAIAAKFIQNRFGNWCDHSIYAYISDGGIQEEISQGAGRIAGFLGLGNLIMFYDANSVQLSSTTDEVTCEDTAKKYEAWGWKTVDVDGTDPVALRSALNEARSEKEHPTLIIGRTIMGQGSVDETGASFEGKISTHGQPLSKGGASFEKSVENLGGDPANPFAIFPETADYYREVLKRKSEDAADFRKKERTWRSQNPELGRKWDLFFSGKIPPLDFASIETKQDSATRASSSEVLAFLAENVKNMIVSSADLSNSDKTDGFLKKSSAFAKGDFSGAFLQAGVSELTMGALANGMALHGGVIPACATFFVFSDYMKPVVRMAALMELPVKFIWTHDAFRVGEDGPTHQPIEQEAQIRLLEKMKNHSGRNSLTVLRPADNFETVAAWEFAMKNSTSPTALILSRQNIKTLPPYRSVRKEEASALEKGAYCVFDSGDDPDIILLGNGSEVMTLIDGAHLLIDRKGLKIRVISAPSEGLFADQNGSYRKTLLPEGVPVFGLTAGLPVTLAGLVGAHGRVVGMTAFGRSAPAEVLDEKFGYTAEGVFKEVLAFLER